MPEDDNKTCKIASMQTVNVHIFGLVARRRSHHEEPFREIILNLNQWFEQDEMSLKDISYLELWQPL